MESHDKYEIYAPYPGANQVVMALSLTIEWDGNKSGENFVKNLIKTRSETPVLIIRNFYVDRARDYANILLVRKIAD